MVTQEDIVKGLRALGVAGGDVILVHSSLKSFGCVEGGAETVIDALLEAVGRTGTVVVPTLTGTREDSPAKPPVFDARHTPCWTGKIPETFRHRADAVRSLHPTHSVAAVGPHADFLIRDHMRSPTPCGPNSPYLRLADLDGKVVFLGARIASCTLLHGVEELAECDYHLQKEPTTATVIDVQGQTHRTTVYLHLWGAARQFPILEPIFLREGILQIGRIGDAEVRVLRARPAVKRTLELLRQSPKLLCKPPEGPPSQ